MLVKSEWLPGVRWLMLVAFSTTALACANDADTVTRPASGPRPEQPTSPPNVPLPVPGRPLHVVLFNTGHTIWPSGDGVGVFVMVRDIGNNRVPGVTVTVDVIRGGGRLDRVTAETGQDGIARLGEWTLGDVPGVNELRARVDGLAPSTWTVEGVAPVDVTQRNGRFRLVGLDGDSLPFETEWNEDRYVVRSALLSIRDDRFVLEMQAQFVGQAYTGVRLVAGSVTPLSAARLLLLPDAAAGRPYFGTVAVIGADGRMQLAPDSDGYWPLVSVFNNFLRLP